MLSKLFINLEDEIESDNNYILLPLHIHIQRLRPLALSKELRGVSCQYKYQIMKSKKFVTTFSTSSISIPHCLWLNMFISYAKKRKFMERQHILDIHDEYNLWELAIPMPLLKEKIQFLYIWTDQVFLWNGMLSLLYL